MKNLTTSAIICLLSFVIGISCYYLWRSHRLSPHPRADANTQSPPISRSEAIEPATPKAGPVSVHPRGPISKVDFRNFTYPGFSGRKSIRVKDGELEYEPGRGCHQSFTVREVDYLDFTGDGEEEALVRMIDHEACGSSWAAVYYYVYTVRNDRPRLMWKFATGSEAHGGEKDFRIEGKDLVFELYGKWEAVGGELAFRENRELADDCCPTHYTVYRVAWDGKRMSRKSVEVLPFTQRSLY